MTAQVFQYSLGWLNNNTFLSGTIPERRSALLAEAGCDVFMIAQLLGHSDVRVTMRYVRSIEETKRAAVEAIKLSSRKSVHKLTTNEIRPPVPAAVNG